MGRKTLIITFILILSAIPVGLSGQEPARTDRESINIAAVEDDYPTDQIIIKFTAGADPLDRATRQATMATLSRAAGVELTFYRPMSGDAYVLKMDGRRSPAEAADISARLSQLATVEYAEPDLIRQITADRQLLSRAVMVAPNDPRLADQWHYDYAARISEGLNLFPAWNITTGSAATVVAVIDTGILNHEDLVDRTVPGYDFISDPYYANDKDGRDTDPSDPGDWVTLNECPFPNLPSNSSWHGTHVAGTIGAATNNRLGIAGVNWQARILPVRVLGKCGGTISDIVDGVRWAAGLDVPSVPHNANPADVLNLSLGGSDSCSATEQDAFNDVTGAGVTVVVAAGNSNDDAANYSPASCNNVITVASTDRTGNRAYYSNYGTVVDISAPGGETNILSNGVLSTLNTGSHGPAGDTYAYYQGTSMAAPHIAGLVSLMLGYKPALTPGQILAFLQNSARSFPAGSNCNQSDCGSGIADAYRTLLAIGPPPVFDNHVFFPLTINKSGDEPPIQSVKNGNFESGPTVWSESSTHSWDLIVFENGLPKSTYPHDGNWTAFLGGGNDEISIIRQQVTVPVGAPFLTYWYWIRSTDVCCYDVGGVLVNDHDVDGGAYWLYTGVNTNGWRKYSVDLGDWAGDSVDLKIAAVTDGSFYSTLLVDDVSFATSPVAAGSPPAPGDHPPALLFRPDDNPGTGR